MSDENKGQPVEIEVLQQLASDLGGKVQEAGRLPDGSGFGVVSFPLPKTHWIFAETHGEYEAPPMALRMGVGHPQRQWMEERIRDAGRYAVRAATMNGREMDFDPDALVQNLVIGLLGYFSDSGLSNDEWANPSPVPDEVQLIEW